MTTTMQEKLTKLAGDHVTVDGVEFTAAGAWANTGTWYAQRGTDTLFSVAYDFQHGYATFKINAPRGVTWRDLMQPVAGNPRFEPWTKRNGLVYYDDGPRIDAFLELFDMLVAVSPVKGEGK